MKVLIAFTEGVSDPAYLKWILKSLNFKQFTDKLSQLPEPFNKNMLERLKNEYNFQESDERKFEDLSRPYTLPRLIMIEKEKSDTLIFVYISKGGSRTDKIKEVISLNVPEPNEDNEFINKEHKYAYIFFSDADKDYSKTEKKIKNEIKDYFSSKTEIDIKIKAGDIFEINEEPISYYIFPKAESTGALEDVILPIMNNNKKELFAKINTFVEENYQQKGIQEDEVAYNIKIKKAKIGVVGQLFKDTVGAGNYSIILNSETKLITKENISEDEISNKIKEIFKNLIEKMN